LREYKLPWYEKDGSRLAKTYSLMRTTRMAVLKCIDCGKVVEWFDSII